MGNHCSGRKALRNCTDEYCSIRIGDWKRRGLLTPGQQFNWQWRQNGEPVGNIHIATEVDQIKVGYTCPDTNNQSQCHEYPIKLQTSVLARGGIRYWLTCPGCARRMSILYFGGKYFACRICYKLNYRSQRASFTDKHFDRLNKIRKKLGWVPGIGNSIGKKPPTMPWQTFDKIMAQYNDCTRRAILAISGKLKNTTAVLSAKR